MAFDFLGTLSLEQLRDIRAFLEEQIEDIDEQINTLIVEIDNAKRTRNELVIADSNLGGDSLQSSFFTELPDIQKIPEQNDSNTAILMEEVKRPFIQNIKFKRERIEFKVKKLNDFIEQMKEEVDRKAIAKDRTIQKLNEIEQQFNDANSNHLFSTTDKLKNFKQGM